jgi:hypothetical protein
MAANYGELKEEVRAYLYNRKDLAVNIPQFIAFAEKKIFRLLRCRANEKLFVGDLSLDNTGFTLPADFIEMKFLTVNEKPLERISEIEYLSKINTDNAGGEPSQFARIIDEIKFWRQADSDYAYSYVYWNDQSGLMVDDADTTPVLLYAPDIYLYASLIEAMPFLVKDERLGTWQAMFSQAMDEIDHQTKESEYAGSPVAVSNAYADSSRVSQNGRRN